MSTLLRRWAYALVSVPCMLIGACTTVGEAFELSHADLRARESAEAASKVRELGERAEARLRSTGELPSVRELNCEQPRCDEPVLLPTRFVRVDVLGTVHAEYHKLGMPFTPLRQFVATWDSASRVTNQDALTSPWMWRLRTAPDLLLGIVLTCAPWYPKGYRVIVRRGLAKSR